MSLVANLAANRVARSSLLLLLLFGTIFVTPLLTGGWQGTTYKLLYPSILVVAALNLRRRRTIFLYGAVAVTAMEWIADFLELVPLAAAALTVNGAFFMLVVASLVAHVAQTKEVDAQSILEAINGYLLLGIFFSFAVALVALFWPESYDFSRLAHGQVTPFGAKIYYGFVTFTTVGYGDITPQTSQARSLAILTGVCGQLYVAIIIAMLVGKFASARR